MDFQFVGSFRSRCGPSKGYYGHKLLGLTEVLCQRVGGVNDVSFPGACIEWSVYLRLLRILLIASPNFISKLLGDRSTLSISGLIICET